MQIDARAPLVARQEIVIAAPPEKVWALLTGIDQWPEWQPGISAAHLEGPLAVGTVFRWKASGLGIRSTIQEYDPPRRIGWTGVSLGMRAVHRWEIEPAGSEVTRVRVEESLAGWFARLTRLFSPAFMEKSMAASLQTLKRRAEQP